MTGSTYRDAGVDLAAADRAKQRIAALAAATHGPEVLGGVGGFGGLFELSGYRRPVLVSGTDNVGTKLKIALAMRRFEALGRDVVNACVNDVIVCGAKPLFFLDYIATGRMDPDLAEEIVRGVAAACVENGCALVGGETSELPGLFAPGEFDLSGFAVGVVERDAIIDGAAIRPGDALLGLPSSGLHTNGFSLVRRIFGLDDNLLPVHGEPVEPPRVLHERVPALDATLGDALLAPHRAYYPLLAPVLPHLKGMAHVTGGGLQGNVPRCLPSGVAARIDLDAWDVPPIFRLVQQRGRVEDAEMYRVFNMGVGMVLVVAPDAVAAVRAAVPEARVIGEVVPGDGDPTVELYTGGKA